MLWRLRNVQLCLTVQSSNFAVVSKIPSKARIEFLLVEMLETWRIKFGFHYENLVNSMSCVGQEL